MLLITFSENNITRIGALEGSAVVDFSVAAPALPRDMQTFIALGAQALQQAQRGMDGGKGRLPLAAVRLLAPLPQPARNIFCIGKNYGDHARELGADAPAPEHPIVFTKAPSCVIGPEQPIPAYLDTTASVDYEGELGVIIGRGGRGIARAEAMNHVYGYTIINDVTSRRLQKQHEQWFIGKSIDGFCPMGPAILTADAVPDVSALRIQTRVNGELRQDGRLNDLIFDIPTLIETLARTMTLLPGDIIATGTPAGVGMGFKPPRFLKAGDVVSIDIGPIGTLTNPVA
jgi:2-keto-4-pentenoate hydratase/2-oxohepta-3-ene-1,7-dioic acid hydratase in catechol pathway